MKFLLLGILVAGAALAQNNSSEKDNSPNSNSLLRSPAAHGSTQTREGASFGPEPVIEKKAGTSEDVREDDQPYHRPRELDRRSYR